jgi:hypothetical protein
VVSKFPKWIVADDVVEVHTLLCASDAAQDTEDAPAPHREIESTRRYVTARLVRLLRSETGPMAMFTLTPDPPFPDSLDRFPPASRPIYMTRLAVDPRTLSQEPLIGLRCLRHAMAVATESGADALRSEANPDLRGTMRLLTLAGFSQAGAVMDDGERRRVGMHRTLS